MSVTRGCEGAVKVGSNYVAQVKGFNFSESAEIIDTSTINNSCIKSFQAGAKQVTGKVDCFWDASDTTGQNALVVGNTVTLLLMPQGDTTGDIYFTGNALITSRELTVNVGGIVECSFSFQISGAFNTATKA